MFKPKMVIIPILALLLAGGIAIWWKQQPPTQPVASPSATASAEPTASPAKNINEYPCLGEDLVSEKLGKKFTLQSEKTLPETQYLECRYGSDEFVKDVLPSFSYSLALNTPVETWQAQHATISAKPSHRRIEAKDYLIADVNPVVELAQVRFWGYQNGVYLELSYTPVTGEAGELLSKGEQLSDLIFKGGQP